MMVNPSEKNKGRIICVCCRGSWLVFNKVYRANLTEKVISGKT